MYNINAYTKLIEERLSDYRYHHSLCVADAAKKLAVLYGADVHKAEIAGILHDVMKESDLSEQLDVIEKAGMTITDFEKSCPKFYHQISGAAYAKAVLGIEDDEIIDAIRYHTTGRSGMTLMDEIIYLADFISADRNYEDVDIMREKVEQGKAQGLLYATAYTIKINVIKGSLLHPDTVNAYNWIINNYYNER